MRRLVSPNQSSLYGTMATLEQNQQQYNESMSGYRPPVPAGGSTAGAAAGNNDANSTNANGVATSDSIAVASNNSNQEQDQPYAFSYSEIKYAMDSFYAIVQPVFITMVLSASAVIWISTPESNAATTAAMENAYNVVHTEDDDSNATQLGKSLINGLVIVSFICFATFVIVLLYMYRCMSCLIGYMVLSSTLLLGFLASMMVRVAIERFQIAVDVLTFYGGMYNFAIVGVVSIFGGPYIVPSYVNQGYLILTSVIVAWQLSHLQPFLAWVLLVLLALYDLFAVLTPCGPLKALVNLMSKDDAPSMPGLLYEASLPVSLPPRGNRVSTNNDNGDSAEADNNRTNRSIQQGQQHQQQQQSSSHSGTTSHENVRDNRDTAVGNEIPEIERCPSATVEEDPDPDSGLVDSTTTTAAAAAAAAAAESSDGADESIEASPLLSPNGAATIATDEGLIEPSRISRVPLALAKVYKLRFLHDPQPPWILSTAAVDAAHTDDASTNDDNAATATSTAANVEFTPEQLCELVDVVFPRNGGRIVPTLSLENANVIYRRTAATDETRYTVIGSRGEHRRVLFINNEGRIFEDLRESNAAEERKERTSIRLGLGDFIFYSILVSKAALFSFTTFAVCTLAVLSGLGLTLLLLAVYGAALPALPVSIALGVVFYLFTRFIMEPWVEAVFTERVYV